MWFKEQIDYFLEEIKKLKSRLLLGFSIIIGIEFLIAILLAVLVFKVYTN